MGQSWQSGLGSQYEGCTSYTQFHQLSDALSLMEKMQAGFLSDLRLSQMLLSNSGCSSGN